MALTSFDIVMEMVIKLAHASFKEIIIQVAHVSFKEIIIQLVHVSFMVKLDLMVKVIVFMEDFILVI